MATSSNRQTFIRFYSTYPNVYSDKGEEIIENSLSLDKTLIEGPLEFGVPCADKFECDLRNDFSVPRKTTIWVYQIIDNDTANPKGLFFGKVESMKMDALGYTTHLVAYDRFYFMRNKSVRKWWKKYCKDDTNSFTVKAIREALLTKYNFTFESVTMLNDARTVYIPTEFKQVTFGEMLTQLCAINACIPHINEHGVVKFIKLRSTIDHTLNAEMMETENCEFEYYDTPVIDGVSVESSSTTVSSDEDDVDDAENVFSFPYNLFFDGKGETSMRRRAEGLLADIQHITYRPCSVKMIQSDYDIKLGDKLQLQVHNNGATVIYYSYVFRNNFSGPMLIDQTIECDGDADFEVNSGGMSGVVSKVNASTETETKTVTVTAIAAVNDVITVKNEENVIVATIIFAEGESQGTASLTIQSAGEQFTFSSSVYGTNKTQVITGNDTVQFQFTATIWIESSVDDVVTISDSGGHVLAEVTCEEANS